MASWPGKGKIEKEKKGKEKWSILTPVLFILVIWSLSPHCLDLSVSEIRKRSVN